jgi:hypothetical protein
VTESIAEFTETGIRTKDGKDHPVDAIIYATGATIVFSKVMTNDLVTAARRLFVFVVVAEPGVELGELNRSYQRVLLSY